MRISISGVLFLYSGETIVLSHQKLNDACQFVKYGLIPSLRILRIKSVIVL